MITEIWIEGKSVDVYENTNIKHTLQVNDVAEIKDRQASLTDSFDVPKTANNVKIFQGLGIHSNVSKLPYQKPNALLKVDGYDFLFDAWLNVKETDNDFKIYIYSGIIEFFKKFENATIGGSLKTLISEIDHNKNLATVAATQTNDNLKYTYLFADFNGRTHRKTDSTVLNIDFIVPSVLVSYLFIKIHEYAGYTFTGSFIGTEDYENWWLSYPKAPEDSTSIVYFAGSDTFNYNFGGQQNQQSGLFNFTFNNGGANGVKILQSGFYNFDVNGSVGVDLPLPNTGISGTASVDFFYSINGGSLILMSNPSVFAVNLNANDVVRFYYTVSGDWNGGGGLTVGLSRLEDVSFTKELTDLKITDFLKDVYNILGLTPFIDNVNKTIKYKTNEERFKNAEVEDWTNNLISIEKESYSFGTYAKENYFRYKYNDQEETHSDGYFKINNENFDATKTLFTSFSYSVENLQTEYYINSGLTESVKVFKLYDKEAQDGTTEVRYKPLSKRYFYLRMRKINTNVVIGSDIQGVNQPLNILKIGEFSKLTMDYFIGKYYSDFTNVVAAPVIWNVKLHVPYAKLIKLDLSKAFYFKQLQQYCFINKINFDDKTCSAEIIKIKDFTTVKPLLITRIQGGCVYFDLQGISTTAITVRISTDGGVTWTNDTGSPISPRCGYSFNPGNKVMVVNALSPYNASAIFTIN